MEIHPLEALIKQYLAEKDITRGSYELYNAMNNHPLEALIR
jgi:hypothetical protein